MGLESRNELGPCTIPSEWPSGPTALRQRTTMHNQPTPLVSHVATLLSGIPVGVHLLPTRQYQAAIEGAKVVTARGLVLVNESGARFALWAAATRVHGVEQATSGATRRAPRFLHPPWCRSATGLPHEFLRGSRLRRRGPVGHGPADQASKLRVL